MTFCKYKWETFTIQNYTYVSVVHHATGEGNYIIHSSHLTKNTATTKVKNEVTTRINVEKLPKCATLNLYSTLH